MPTWRRGGAVAWCRVTTPAAPASPPSRPRVVIVGGGFGGLQAAKALAGRPVDVTLVDRKNHHTFQPLLYQVALAVLTPAEVAQALRRILRRAPNVRPVLGEVAGFDLAARQVHLREGGHLPYDYLIVAAGARHAYFGHDAWEADAPGLKTIEDAVEIRRRLLTSFENAEREALLTGRAPELRFAVIGGGPTGVELAGAIADLARLVLARDFKTIDTRCARVCLYEGAPRVLGAFAEESSAAAERQLRELGVEVFTRAMITAVEPGRVRVGETWERADVTLWATGVAASPLGRLLSTTPDRAGRVPVAPDLSLPDHPEIFVIGDLATLTDARGQAVPGLAAAAMQQGSLAAENLLRDHRGEARCAFVYRDRGLMATIGHHRAVAELGGRRFAGLGAWLLWSLVHVLLLIGFRNRLAVMSEWIWAYLKREGASPLITDHRPRFPETPVT
jgi:NADH dehydrogenase